MVTRRQRVLLLNPPGRDLYMRDYYCSKTSKGRYYYHPVDLLFLSGRLAEHHEVTVLDAIAEGLGEADVAERIVAGGFDAIVFVTGTVSWTEDSLFFARLRPRTGARIVGSGDLLRSAPGDWLERAPWLDAILLDFAAGDVLGLLAAPGGARGPWAGVAHRAASGEVCEGERSGGPRTLRIPRPRHELFPLERYRFPFARRHPIATVLSDFGCAYSCDFCQMGPVALRLRPVGDVLEEIDFLHGIGVRELFWRDQTFGVHRERTAELMHGLLGRDMGWTCFSRCDVLDGDQMLLMKRAGCHTVIFGVESASQPTLDAHGKGMAIETIRQGFRTARNVGLRTAGTFMIGLPEDTEETVLATIELAKEIECDFASFNMATPRMGTEFRQVAVASGWVDPDLVTMESAVTRPVLSTDRLSADDIWRLRNRAVRSFYLRPGYLRRRVAGIRSWHDARTLVGEAVPVLRRALGG